MTKLVCFVFGFDEDAILDFGFLCNLTTSACNLVRFVLAVLPRLFRILTDGYCFYGAISVTLAEKID